MADRGDVRAIHRINGRAWRAAYEGIVPEELIESVAAPLDAAGLDATYETYRGVRPEGAVLVAERDADGAGGGADGGPGVGRDADAPSAAGDGTDAGDDDAAADGEATDADGDDGLPAPTPGVVGYAAYRWGEDTKPFVDPGAGEAGLKQIYVDPAHWGAGVGTALLTAGLERLPDRIERLKLSTLVDNDRGRGFYEARGFEVVGDHEERFGGHAVEEVVYARSV